MHSLRTARSPREDFFENLGPKSRALFTSTKFRMLTINFQVPGCWNLHGWCRAWNPEGWSLRASSGQSWLRSSPPRPWGQRGRWPCTCKGQGRKACWRDRRSAPSIAPQRPGNHCWIFTKPDVINHRANSTKKLYCCIGILIFSLYDI